MNWNKRDNQFFFLLFDKVKTIDLAFFFCLFAEFPDRDQLELSKRKSDFFFFKSTFRANQRQYDVQKIFRSTLLQLQVDTTVDAFWFDDVI